MKIRWIVAGGVAAYALTSMLLTSPWSDTRYADGYDAEAFSRIRTGDTESSVRALLGEPLMVAIGPDEDGGMRHFLHYSKTDRSPSHMVRRCVVVDDVDRRVTRVDDAVVWNYGSRLFSPRSRP